MYLRVVLKQLVRFKLVKGVVNHGVGHVGKSIVRNIMIRLLVNAYLRQKIAMMLRVVRKKMGSSKMSIVLVDIQAIVRSAGNYII